MDKEGIGTDATISEHIATILKRNYAEKNQAGRFVPTNIGLALVETYGLFNQIFKLEWYLLMLFLMIILSRTISYPPFNNYRYYFYYIFITVIDDDE